MIGIQLLTAGCGVVKWMTGTDLDTERFNNARMAKVYEKRADAAAKLSQRLKNNDPINNADLVVYLSPTLLTKLLKQYENSTGWLDPSTSYTIRQMSVELHQGSAIATALLDARHSGYSVDVKLNMDCLLTIENEGGKLVTKLEPFNISADVNAAGVLGAAEDIIKNMIKINLAEIGKQLPPNQIPLDFTNKFLVQATNITIKDKLNMLIASPGREIDYALKLKELLIFNNCAFVALNLNQINVK